MENTCINPFQLFTASPITMTMKATCSSPQKRRAGHGINTPQCATNNFTDICCKRIKGMKPGRMQIMSMPHCCHFWLLIPSNPVSSDFSLPDSITKRHKSHSIQSSHSSVSEFYVRLRKSQNSLPSYSSWWSGLCPLPDFSDLLPMISTVLYPSSLMDSPPSD